MKDIMTNSTKETALEQYFQQLRKNIIGIEQEFESPFGRKKSSTPIGPQAADCIDLSKRN